MHRDEFWAIVEKVKWDELTAVKDSGRAKEDRSYEVGKRRLLEVLPTLEVLRAFDAHYREVSEALYKNQTEWVNEGYGRNRSARTCDLGDDSFGDLLAHIVGLGREEYEASLAEPERVQSRGLHYHFSESFSYCLPSESEYEPLEIQLAREVSALAYWQGQLEAYPESPCSQSEVEWRTKACESLRERLLAQGGTEWTQEQYQAHEDAESAAADAWHRAEAAKRKAKEVAREALLADFEAEWDAKSLEEWL